ncbi:MAG: dihydropteroate synthase [Hyphomicrobiales bacterium]|nr:dihydropteroate synthase [Hyphomicrobiales bacterium]
MPDGVYLRPTGLLHGQTARVATAHGKAGWLAGGPLAFSLCEVIEGEPGRAKRRIAAYGELAAARERAITVALERITHARDPLAGLSLDRPRIMGVVNVTPDSFSDGGLHNTTEAAIAHGAALAAQGADILDIGGESTRPGSDAIDAAREATRILPVIEGLQGVGAVISADSRKSDVMRRAAETGAHILNDVSALTFDEESLSVAVACGLPVVLMHAQGDPKTMQDSPAYEDVVLEVFDFLEMRIGMCEAAGLSRARIIVDPGIGFGKTLEHNLALLEAISLFHSLGTAILVGVSRKRFIGTLTGEDEPRKRLAGSLAAGLAAVAQGVQILRVHDVRETVNAVAVWRAATNGSSTGLV